MNARTLTTGPCIRFYSALPKYMWQSRLAMPNNSVPVLKRKEDQH